MDVRSGMSAVMGHMKNIRINTEKMKKSKPAGWHISRNGRIIMWRYRVPARSQDKITVFIFCIFLIGLSAWLHYHPLPQIGDNRTDVSVDDNVFDFTAPLEFADFEENLEADDAIDVAIENNAIDDIKSEPAQAYYLSGSERHTVECIIAGEAGNEDLQEMMLVAQTIWQNCVDDDMSPSQVRKKYQYAGWKEIDDMPQDVQDNVKAAADRIFVNGEKVVSEPIKVFYNPHIAKSKWHESQRHIITAKSGTKFFAYKY